MRKTAVLVSGFYRSGTSMLSGILNGSGVAFLSDTPPDDGNPKGYFEWMEISSLVYLVEAARGTGLSGLNEPAEDWASLPAVAIAQDRLREIIETAGEGRPLIGIKHPAISLHLPMFAGALASAGYNHKVLMPWRNPYAAATSMRDNWGIPISHGLLLFARYMIQGERHTRNVPRAFLEYDTILSNPARAVNNAMREIGLPMPVRGVTFMDRSLNRSVPVDRATVFPPLVSLVENVMVALRGNAGPDEWAILHGKLRAITDFLNELHRSPWYLLPPAKPKEPLVTADTIGNQLEVMAESYRWMKAIDPNMDAEGLAFLAHATESHRARLMGLSE